MTKDTFTLSDGTLVACTFAAWPVEPGNPQAIWEDQREPVKAGCEVYWTDVDLTNEQMTELEGCIMKEQEEQNYE